MLVQSGVMFWSGLEWREVELPCTVGYCNPSHVASFYHITRWTECTTAPCFDLDHLRNTEYFCVEKCVSLWPAAREAARPTATQQSPVPTHMATIHHCPPPTSTSLLPSILSFLICSSHPRRLLSARSHSSRPATSTGALLIVVSHERGNVTRHGSQLDSPHPADGLHIVAHRRRV